MTPRLLPTAAFAILSALAGGLGEFLWLQAWRLRDRLWGRLKG